MNLSESVGSLGGGGERGDIFLQWVIKLESGTCLGERMEHPTL